MKPHKWLVWAAVMGGAISMLAPAPRLARASGSPSSAADGGELAIPYTLRKLDNGLAVILHEDHRQPLVVVNVNVNVGSADEPRQRTGFAHLFEHLMFMGTKRVAEKMYDEWMEREGAWNNAWTSEDRTDYFEVGPSHALPLLLWMEADRLGVLGDQIDEAKLDAQRDVVKNERRQRTENRPYEVVELKLPELLFPEGHPYHHPVIGSHRDLEAASVKDVRAFFDTWYVPDNMALTVAGDFDPATVGPLVDRYFGALNKGRKPRVRGAAAKPAELTGVVRATLPDNVSLPMVVMAWPSPAGYAPGDAELDILSEILSTGKASRLYKALVYDQKIAQAVQAHQESMRLRSRYRIEVLARPGVPLDKIEHAIDAELDRLRTAAPSAQEIRRAKNQYETGFVSRLQSLRARASILSGYYSRFGDPGYTARDLERYRAVTAEGVREVAHKVLDPRRRVIVHVVPRAKAEAGKADAQGEKR